MTIRVDKTSGEIFLYGAIGDYWTEESFTATDVLKALEKLDGKRAIARINSPGGSVDDGIATFNALKRYKPGVDTVVDGIAASSASFVALAGEKRTTSPGAKWMIHKAWTLAMGNADEMAKTVEALRMYDADIAKIYSQYIKGTNGQNITVDEALSMMASETWFTDEASLAAGLSTDLGDGLPVEPIAASWIADEQVKGAAKTIVQTRKRWQTASAKAKALTYTRVI